MQQGIDPYCKVTDEELIVLLNRGDYIAFKEVYQRYNSLLLIYAYRKLQDKEEAKDIVQDVFINLWSNRDQFTLKSTLAGYLYKAVLNKALNIMRHKGISDKYVAEIQHLITAQTATTDYLIREKDITALIEKEIALLPLRMREVFELRTKEHLSNKDIADRLNISEHTVATHIKKALRVLKIKFGAHAVLLYLLMR
ncbi:RNA polymerase sigma factor [Mucilaginibacter phyllosphaerae]|uniref:RNA polymerase sigma-70 factor n=1 Tax=Mucilaginibacter phyllosphaerae TaxID=1812349 RepID=A0A4Y8AD61_9SPHI|nr:RNA polymerase sigma-70 factor [Mucilaginibacter phyllosphaerae]MBB3969218.1 RNA polymerase sigma-70 factor (family 1) [Mucilaginibacter phyllosphaerae]TEW65979.1 RNA polymerase sigma-70 factor [Mucilaginibacter phyllosphaerae]GGH07059.1 DNA-directed RNA polymerase sigma-70 factor [Mucilaginibacter phyllosphaerae]